MTTIKISCLICDYIKYRLIFICCQIYKNWRYKIIEELLEKLIKRLNKDEIKMHFPKYDESEQAIEKLVTFYNKANCNMTLLKQEQEILRNKILEKQNKDYFEVVNMESTTGKTYTMINSIPYYLRDIAVGRLEKKGILIVLRQISECDKYASELNNLFNRKVALSVNSDEYKDLSYDEQRKIKQKQLIKAPYYPVIFITHSKYQLLCSNETEKDIFTKNRRLLIIDESLDICEIVRLDSIFFDVITHNLLDQKDLQKLSNIITPIEERIKKARDEKNVIHNFKIKKEKLEILEDVGSKENLKKYGNGAEFIERFIFLVRCIYSGITLINVTYSKDRLTEQEKKKVEISTINYQLKMWTLSNNIILDASSPLNMKYALDTRLYHNLNLEPVLDHSKWNISYIWANSTKSAKGLESDELEENYIYRDMHLKEIQAKVKYRKRFYKYCSEIITELGEKDTLAVGTKVEHIIKFQNEEKKANPFSCNIPLDNIVHYGNITGKREYGNLKNVLVFHTFNFRDTDYILQYLYYSNITELKDGTTFKTRQSDILENIPIFVDSKLQEYKEKTMANHLYQAIKRVNREMTYNTNVVIISIYLGAILYVRDMLKNCQCEENKEYYLKFNSDSEVKDKTTKIQEDYEFSDFFGRITNSDRAIKVIQLFEDILKGKIPKDLCVTRISEHIIELKLEEMRNYLKITTKQASKILSLDTVQEFLSENLVIYNKCRFHFTLY